jgi:hypothetical protein
MMSEVAPASKQKPPAENRSGCLYLCDLALMICYIFLLYICYRPDHIALASYLPFAMLCVLYRVNMSSDVLQGKAKRG